MNHRAEGVIRHASKKIGDACAGQGDRHRTVYGTAVWLGRMVAGEVLTEDEAEDAITTAAVTWIAESSREAERTIRQGLQKGINLGPMEDEDSRPRSRRAPRRPLGTPPPPPRSATLTERWEALTPPAPWVHTPSIRTLLRVPDLATGNLTVRAYTPDGELVAIVPIPPTAAGAPWPTPEWMLLGPGAHRALAPGFEGTVLLVEPGLWLWALRDLTALYAPHTPPPLIGLSDARLLTGRLSDDCRVLVLRAGLGTPELLDAAADQMRRPVDFAELHALESGPLKRTA